MKNKKSKHLRKKRFFFLSVLFFVVLVLVTLCFYERHNGDILKSIDFSQSYTDRNGEVLRIFITQDEQYRIRSPLSDFPYDLIESVLLQEDRYFYAHHGVNPAALFKAAYTTWIHKSRRMGASTITMQVVRLVKQYRTDTVFGKIRQIGDALILEACHPKQRILEAYMNLAPMGKNIQGFQAGSLYYFEKPARLLNFSEALFLAVLPQDPLDRTATPSFIPTETITARNILYETYLKEHPEKAQTPLNLSLPINIHASFPFRAPHFTDRARKEELNAQVNKKTQSLTRTSLDLSMQTIAERELTRWIERNRLLGVENGAVLVADRLTGEILASVGSASWFNEAIEGQVDGTLAKRSPGSTLKPFIYALAFDAGLIHPMTMLKDRPTGFNEYTPDNYQSDFAGPISAQKALTDSRNIPAIALARDLVEQKGVHKTLDLYGLLQKAQITKLKDKDYYGLSLVLGSAELSMDELVSLYGALSREGLYTKTKIFLDAKMEAPVSLFSAEAAFTCLKMLESNEIPQTRSQNVKNIPLAYKTGTSIGFKDAWSLGISGPFIIAVWVGNFSGQGNSAFLGRSMATPLMVSITDALLTSIPEESRVINQKVPDTLRKVEVCAVSGALPNEDCPNTVLTWYLPGSSPIETCKIHRAVYINTKTGLRTDQRRGSNIVKEVFEFWPSDLLNLFEEAGLPRLVPPPLESSKDLRSTGFPPEILSPLSNTQYIIRLSKPETQTLVLDAATDADTTEIFWFVDGLFIGRNPAGKKNYWLASGGNHRISAVDSKGRTSSIVIEVNIGLPEKLD